MTEIFFRDCCPHWKSLLWPSLHYESLSPPAEDPRLCAALMSFLPRGRLVSVFCVICQYWETVERLWCLHWLKGDLVLMTNFQDEPGSCFKTRRTLHNQRHTDTSKCTTWLPHERFDWTNTPHFQSFANIKPYAYLRVKRGRTFYWLNFCVCSLS